MSRIQKAKGKIVRHLGVNVFETPKYERLLKRKSNPPGKDRPSRKKLSNYGMQLLEKQKLRFAYGITETQFRNVYSLARNMSGRTGEKMIELLERRLDNTVFRLGFAASRSQARQFVSHGHVLVNGERADIPSYVVEVGDDIAVKSRKSSQQMVRNAASASTVQDFPWLSVNKDELKGKLLDTPKHASLPIQVDVQRVVEFYSR